MAFSGFFNWQLPVRFDDIHLDQKKQPFNIGCRYDCLNHSADNAVWAHAKGPYLRGRMVDCLHTLREERGKRRDVVNMSSQDKINILPRGPEMLKSSLMLRSIYSPIKELLRNTLSKYKL